MLVVFVLSLAAPALADREPVDESQARVPVIAGPRITLTSAGSVSALAARETTGPDTFALYGGSDHPTEGKFQLGDRVTPDWGGGNGLPGGTHGGGPDAWTPADLTFEPNYWQRSTFNAENLNDNGPGNHAMWCGVAAEDPEAADWNAAPGYGNGWFGVLLYESEPLSDPAAGQTVDLEFYFNQEAEPGYDVFKVEYDSAGYWTEVFRFDQYTWDDNGQVVPPGARFSEFQARPIAFTGDDYGFSELLGGTDDRIRIRLLFVSDGAWSDQDGLWPTEFGAVQVDDITLTTSQGTFTEGFEGAGPYLFAPEIPPFAGDYAEIHPQFTDLDPCRENATPVAAFVDYGQVVRNGPGVDGTISTGGSHSSGVEYGIPGNYVNNYHGGLSSGQVNLTNEIWSPAIAWDLPGPEDDDPSISGAKIRFDVWVHLPLINGMFYLWHVRSARPGRAFESWMDRNFVYYGSGGSYYGAPSWLGHREDVSDLLAADPERVQMALAVWDYASIFGFPGTAATPSPVFDNAAFYKYRVAGPVFATRVIDTAQDGFPVVDSVDVSTQASRDALDIPFSMARDVNTGERVLAPGDSVIVDVGTVIPGTSAVDIRMVWALETNPVFEDAIRSAPSRTEDENVVAGPAGTVWTGEVVAAQSTTSAGTAVDGRYFVDLPDVDFMYPGDVLHYYFEATDSEGRVSTLPFDTEGFGQFGPGSVYDRAFCVRGLPSLRDTAGAQPTILVYNEFGRRGGEQEWTTAFRQLGYEEGLDFDSYTVQGPTSSVSNGIGSAGAHGATSGQLSGYESIFHFTGDLSYDLLSDGVGQWADKGDDVETLRGWLETPGVRNIAHFGDGIATGNYEYPEMQAYVHEVMGVEYIGPEVRASIGNQAAPVIVPNTDGAFSSSFATELVAYGGCTRLNRFDHIRPQPTAYVGHYFAHPDGSPITDVNAGVGSVIHPLAYGISITFPVGIPYMYDPAGRTMGLAARTLLFGEILGLFGASPGTVPVAAPRSKTVALQVVPNPFNPSTVVSFTAPLGSRGSVKVFNLRGELVRTLHTGEFHTQEFRWEGTDSRGAPVASGVYLVRATDGKVTQTQKVALVK
jgi:hypothetical protein